MAGDTNSETGRPPNLLSGLRLDELLREVQDRLAEIMATRDRMQGLLDAFLAVGTGSGARHHPAAPRRGRRRPGSGPVRGAGCARRARRPLPVPLRRHRRGDPRGDGPSPRGQGSAGAAHRRPASVAAGRPEHARGLGRLPGRITRRCAASSACRCGCATRCSATCISPRRWTAASSPTPTRSSSRRSPPRRASPCRTRTCSNRPGCGSGGWRRPPRSVPSCWRGRATRTRCASSRSGRWS